MNKIKKILCDIKQNPTPFIFGWLSGMVGLAICFLVAGIFHIFVFRDEIIGHSISIGIPIGILVHFLLSLYWIHKSNEE